MNDAAYGYLILVVAAVCTYGWRALGVALAGRIGPNSLWLEWIGCVAYALLAGLIARMLLLPAGPLMATDTLSRAVGVGLAVAVYIGLRRNILAGVLAGAGALTLLESLWGAP